MLSLADETRFPLYMYIIIAIATITIIRYGHFKKLDLTIL